MKAVDQVVSNDLIQSYDCGVAPVASATKKCGARPGQLNLRSGTGVNLAEPGVATEEVQVLAEVVVEPDVKGIVPDGSPEIEQILGHVLTRGGAGTADTVAQARVVPND